MTADATFAPVPAPRHPRRRRVLASQLELIDGPVLVGVYIRVSMAREEMISPELQRRDVDAFLLRMSAQTGREWRAVTVEQDLDISGRSFARAGIQRLLALVRQGGITTIVTYRYDRFGRNLRQSLEHLEEVEALGAQVVSVTEPFDATTAIGNYMRSQTLAMADLYSRQISESWKRVQEYRVARGLPTNGRERYGYLAHRTTQRRHDGAWRLCPQGCGAGECETGFAPDPETAPIVQRIYRSYIDGTGFQGLAKALNAERLETPGQVAARRSGNPKRVTKVATAVWTASAVIELADSGFAAGLIPHNGAWYPGAHEPLITEQVWLAYQQRRDSQRRTPTKARSPRWSLAGIAVCDECDGPIHCSSSPRGVQYHLSCGNYKAGICQGVYRTRAAVEAAVELWLERYADELDRATRDALRSQPRRQQPDGRGWERRKLTKIVQQADERIRRLLDAYTDGALELADYKRKREEIQAEVDEAQSRLEALTQPEAEPPTPAAVKDFAATWPTLSPETRREVLLALVRQVRVCKNKDVIIVPRWTDEPITITFTKNGQVPSRRGLHPKK